jgi:hypothetical protein
MRLREICLGVSLVAYQLCGASLAQQAVPTPVVAPPAEPHPAPAAAPAGATVYNVEVIVFRTNTALGAPEDWASEAARAPAVPAAGEGETGVPASESSGQAASGARFIRALTPAEFQLADLEAKIKSSGSYVPVAHVGWAQTASAWGSHESMSLQQLGFDDPQLAGTITLERGQFLHLGLALDLTVATPPSGLEAAPNTTFVLNDNHRVKFYERNYFDSPAFGVIALVVPAQGARRAGR